MSRSSKKLSDSAHWSAFERAVDVAVKGGPKHRKKEKSLAEIVADIDRHARSCAAMSPFPALPQELLEPLRLRCAGS